MAKRKSGRQNVKIPVIDVLQQSNDYFISYLSGVLSIAISILILIIIDIFISKNLSSLDKPDIEILKKIFAIRVSECLPEIVEKLQFYSGIVIAPVLLLFLNYLFLKIFSKINKLHNTFTISSFVITILIFSLFIIAFNSCTYSSKYVYIQNSLMYKNLLVSFVLFIFIVLLILNEEKIFKNQNKMLAKSFTYLFYLVPTMIIITIASFIIYDLYSLEFDHNKNFHLSAYFFSIVNVFHGKALLIDFTNTYGLYPHFLEFIFKITGLSVFKFTAVMGIMFGLSLLVMFLFLKDIVKSKVICFAGLASIIFINYLNGYMINPVPYYQYFPHRLIFPSLLIFLSWIYFKKNSKLIYYISFILYSIGILWNMDVGIIVFITWIITLIFSELFKNNYKTIIRKSLLHCLAGISILSMVILAFSVYMYLRYGSFPKWIDFFEYQISFYKYGFGMLPMTLIHPWNLLIITYMTGLSISFQSLILRKPSNRVIMFFLLSILGVGIFSYFQGRSHDYTLVAVFYPALLLATAFADDMFSYVKDKLFSAHSKDKKNVFITYSGTILLLAGLLFFLTSSIFSMVYNYNYLFTNIKKNINIMIKKEPTILTRTVDFVNINTEPDEEVLIISHNAEIYYLGSQTICPLKSPAPSEILLIRDLEIIKEFVRNTRGEKIFFEESYLTLFLRRELKEDLVNTINQFYEVEKISKDKNMFLLVPRKNNSIENQ